MPVAREHKRQGARSAANIYDIIRAIATMRGHCLEDEIAQPFKPKHGRFGLTLRLVVIEEALICGCVEVLTGRLHLIGFIAGH